jgi:hypothetical protein
VLRCWVMLRDESCRCAAVRFHCAASINPAWFCYVWRFLLESQHHHTRIIPFAVDGTQKWADLRASTTLAARFPFSCKCHLFSLSTTLGILNFNWWAFHSIGTGMSSSWFDIAVILEQTSFQTLFWRLLNYGFLWRSFQLKFKVVKVKVTKFYSFAPWKMEIF